MTNLLPLLFAGMPGGWELWVVLLIILILFGSRLPGIARSLGQGINEFKRGLNDGPERSASERPNDAKPAPKDEAPKA